MASRAPQPGQAAPKVANGPAQRVVANGAGAALADADKATSAQASSVLTAAYDPVQYLTGPVSLWTNCEWG
jgi:hypothetical protein